MEKYDLNKAYSKLRNPLNQVKDVMRYSDVRGIHINKWSRTDDDGRQITRIATSIDSTMEDEYYTDDEED